MWTLTWPIEVSLCEIINLLTAQFECMQINLIYFSGKFEMKKFHQLLLLLLSGVSLLCFVFYKHEYDRLRKVMEVLDMFGSTVTEDVKNSEQYLNKSVNTRTDFWHRYADGFYVYSAFKVSNEKDWSMNSIAVVSKDSQSSALMKDSLCAIITGDAVEEKFEGTIEWKEISTNNVYLTYSLTCNVPEIRGDSHLFSLYDTKSNQLNFPLHLSSLDTRDQLTTLCTVSSQPLWKPNQLMKFINYYTTLGIDNFYLYHQGVSDQIISVLNEFIIQADGSVAIHLLTWNQPFSQSTIDLSLVQSECDLRHSTKAGPVVTVHMGHYLVASGKSKIADFLKMYTKGPEWTHQISLTFDSVCYNFSSQGLVKSSKKQPASAYLRWTDSGSPLANHLETIQIEPDSAKMFTLEPCSINSMSSFDTGEGDPLFSRFSKLM